MEICENCKRKDKENKNIQTKELNEIIEADKINFQTGNNKIEKVFLCRNFLMFLC